MGSEPGDLREAKCLENWKSTLDASKYSNHHLAQRWYLDILKTYPGNLHSGPPIHPQAKMLIHRFCVDLRKDLSQQRVQGKQTWYKMVYACTDCKKRTKPWQLSYLSSSLSKRSICACVCVCAYAATSNLQWSRERARRKRNPFSHVCISRAMHNT